MIVSTSYPLHKIRVLLLEGVHPRASELLTAQGYTVTQIPGAMPENQLIDEIPGIHLLGLRSKSQVTPRVLEHAERLWSIGCFCIGADQVDLAAAASQGIAIFNAPFSNTRSVAELTIAEIVALHRSMCDRSNQMHAGKWNKTAANSNEVRGRTLGIIGYGRIGSQVSILAEALGMRVLFYETAEQLPLGNATRCASLKELLSASDVVTLHVPANDSTKGMIGPDELRTMKPGAYLINNARGTVVHLDSLASALREGHIAGAALDVYPQEPNSNKAAFTTPLAGIENVILTPHIGGSTQEAQRSIAEEVAGKLVRFMNIGTTATALNVPAVELPQLHENRKRILHYHKNVPGVLSKMHAVIADLGVNISAEYLQSDQSHGYVILDIDPQHEEDVLTGLRAIPETIRVRSLW